MRVFKYLVVLSNDDVEAEEIEHRLDEALADYGLLESTAKEVVE